MLTKAISSARWKQMTGKIKEKWGKLTDDELDVIDGKLDQLVGKLQEKYAIKSNEIEKDVKDWYEQHFGKAKVKARKAQEEGLLKKLQKL